MIRSGGGEGYVVTRPEIFVYWKPGVAELKLEHSAAPFGLSSFQL